MTPSITGYYRQPTQNPTPSARNSRDPEQEAEGKPWPVQKLQCICRIKADWISVVWLCSSTASPCPRPSLPRTPWPYPAKKIKDTSRTTARQPNLNLTGKPLHTVHTCRQVPTTRSTRQKPQRTQHRPPPPRTQNTEIINNARRLPHTRKCF